MYRKESRKKATAIFLVTLLIALALLGTAAARTAAYNSAEHYDSYTGEALFGPKDMEAPGVTVAAVPRSSTWNKIFDINNEGITEENFQAFTYDFTVANNTKDEVESFTFKLTLSSDVYLASAWNGALELHQNVKGGELVETVPDLREFHPEDYDLEVFTVDGESFVHMYPGDYIVYYPSSSMNAMEVPVEPYEGTTPGIIMYIEFGDDINDSVLEIEYKYHRVITSEPLFWIAIAALALWLIAFIIFAITSAQIKKYQERHERDNEIINESIETFTGFIDAKDPYTNGHSKRVAIYTKRLAKEMGYDGEELDRIYYIALLHDCGKIGVPDSILGKPGRLTEGEFDVIKSHTTRGGEILSSFTNLKDAGLGARYHHERYDGNGYPEGRKGDEIPLIARMICVADSFDAMNTDRVYRKRLSRERIISELEQNRGLQFDPLIADIMLRLIKNGEVPVGD